MKKTYIAPEVVAMTIRTEEMISVSNPSGFNGQRGTTGTDGSAALVKERESYNVWNDDWSE